MREAIPNILGPWLRTSWSNAFPSWRRILSTNPLFSGSSSLKWPVYRPKNESIVKVLALRLIETLRDDLAILPLTAKHLIPKDRSVWANHIEGPFG